MADVSAGLRRLTANIDAQVVAQHVEEREEDRQLRDERQARPERVDLVLLVQRHQLLLLLCLSSLCLACSAFICGASRCIACIDLSCLTVSGTRSARTTTVRTMIEKPQPSPTLVVEALDHRLEDVDQRLEDVA